jgi:hypothetical protein
MVNEVEYFVNATFAEKVYDSCKNVYSPGANLIKLLGAYLGA